MKLFAPSLCACATVALLATPAAAQTSPAQDLLGEGDVLPNGEIVEYVWEAHVHDSGSWAMRVRTQGSSTVVVRNGVVVMAVGDIFYTGEEVLAIRDIDMSPTGLLAYALTLGSGVTGRDVIFTLGQIFLEEFSTFPDPYGSVNDYMVRDFTQVAIAYPYMVVQTAVTGGGSAIARGAVVRYDFTNPFAPVALVLSEDGKTAPGGGVFGPVPVTSVQFDVLEDGRALTTMSIAGDDVVLFDGVIVARDNQTAPDAGYRWNGTGVTDARISSAGHLMLSGDVEFASGGFAGRRIFVDGVMRVDEGQPFGSGTSGPYYYRGNVDRLGRLHYTHNAGPVAGYALDGKVLMEEGLCTVGGATVLAFDGFDLEAISDSGRYVIVSPLTGNGSIFGRHALLETELGNIVASCPVVPNSTGVVSSLEASGSSTLGVGPFPMTAVDLPAGQAGLLLCSRTSNVTLNPAGSTGNLCLGGNIGRFMAQIGLSSASGTLDFTIDPLGLPQPGGTTAAVAGERWGFQLWHRDGVGGVPTNNFSETRAILFR